MTDVTLVREEAPRTGPPETQVLFREARRRRRLRIVRATLVVVVTVVMVVVGLYATGPTNPGGDRSGTPSSPASSYRTGTTLVYSLNDLRVINADSGASRTLPLPAPPGGSSDLEMVRSGDSLLLNRGDAAWLYHPGLDESPVNLGSSLRIIPGPAPDEVWLWTDPCFESPVSSACSATNPENDYGQGDVQLVDFAGHRIGAPVALPTEPPPPGSPVSSPGAAWFPTGDTVDGGIVLAPLYRGQYEEVWDPTSKHVIRAFRRDVSVLAARGQLVAWTTGRYCLPKCTLHLTNVRTGVERAFALPSGSTTIESGSFSPDGATLAIPVGLGGAWPGRHPTALALVNIRTRTVGLLPGSKQTPNPNIGAFDATWSSTGWLFYTAYGYTHVLAWRPGDQRALVLPKARLPGISTNSPGTELPSLVAL